MRLLRLAETDSTNLEARRRAEAGERGPVWIMSDRQTAGRGRAGRLWEARDGDLTASLLFSPQLKDASSSGLTRGSVPQALSPVTLDPRGKPEGDASSRRRSVSPIDAALYSFVAALAVADTLDAYLDPARITLKWPNDVLVDGRKIAGILLESSGGDPVDWLIVGIGLNLRNRPAESRWPPVALGDLTAPPAPQDALDKLAAAFARRAGIFEAEGFAPIRAAWRARAARIGETIEARLPRQTLSGRFADIDEDGALVLETSDGPRRIAAGDVHF